MPDRHKIKPMSLRFPEALSAWLREHSEATGLPVRRIVLQAVEEYRERAKSGATTPAQGTTTRKTPHRCPVKGWCGTCNDWKGAK